MNVLPTKLPGLILLEPRVFGDERGFFMESWNRRRYAEYGVDVDFVQDNLSQSRHGVLRGLHFQEPSPQAKLVSVLQGEVFDVGVDVRVGSPTFGQWEGVLLSGENRRQFYLPAGFAHGFCVTSEIALFGYKCSSFYTPEHERSVLWNDPEIGIEWPVDEPVLSDRDAKALPLREVAPAHLPSYAPRDAA